jgi:hypothetical protein
MGVLGNDKTQDNRKKSHKARIRGAVVVTIYSPRVYGHVKNAAVCRMHIEIFKRLIQI